MPNEDLSKALEMLKIEDIRIDPRGRLVIDNPDVARRLEEIGDIPRIPGEVAADTNIICCGNGSCGKESALTDFLERMAGGTGIQGLTQGGGGR
jgi:hypothetical protein